MQKFLFTCLFLILFVGSFCNEEEVEEKLFVQELLSENFEELTEEGPWLIKFFAPWCGHCKRMAPAFEEAAKKLDGEVKVGGVDCTENKDICSKFGVRGYPTIKFFYDGKEFTKYSGDRSVDNFVEFSNEKAKEAQEQPKEEEKEEVKEEEEEEKEYVKELLSENFEELTEEGPWLIKFFAPWCGHCKRMAPAFEEAAKKLDGKVKVGGVDCTENKDICSKFGVRGYPTIKFFYDGKEFTKYSGDRSVDNFVEFSNEKAKEAQEQPKEEAKEL
ncbi:protein disulfide-isomerase c17h9.14c-related [Anaeramoeba flamelloides]|uniref:Protein disulfide-isomerase c17h9.14c-related n=1 Tax=Anaeramoeba flamelloides TaxID=1746091 RepID=A0AAV7YV81_9EUKA|nr:protein disulfide-isomerase c17h9.14c-related [Anaeramoeba flamelloides]